MTRLPKRAALDWTPDGAVRSTHFGDVYFSRSGGLAETEAVFLRGCRLPEEWRGRDRFTIVELGFGTGLNALATWRLWREARSPGAVLHFVSIEAFPVDVADAQRAHAPFSELAELSRRLRDFWPVRARAAQRIAFDGDGFILTVVQDDARGALDGLVCEADAWFLDGFSPARNPDMWSADLMRLVAARSAPGARLATYSVAGDVRRALEAAGFAVEKKPGFGAKRERLEARLEQRPARSEPLFPAAPTRGRVAIVGGGIAGAAMSFALRRRGRDCVICEAEELGAGASGSPAALVMPRLDRGGDVAAMHLGAFIHAAQFYERLGVFERCGVLELPGARGADALADLVADPPLPPDWLEPRDGGLFHARAGLVRTCAALSALTMGSEVRIVDVAAITRDDAFWRLRSGAGKVVAEAEAVVLAAGARLKRFEQTRWLPLRLSRGQLEWAKGGCLQTGVSASAYAAPLDSGVLFGATFDEVDKADPPYPDEDSRRRNLAALARLAPETAAAIHNEQLVSRASLRASTPDYAPLAGLMPDSPMWRAQNAPIAFGRAPPALEAPSLSGLYVFGGLGARGFTLAPLLAECLASEICEEPACLSRTARYAIHPARYLLRALKKKEGISDYS
jgi:tRNA 5-methylaminomethyl-2-thiouridine biosynthesis bifunctional protein